MPEATPNRTRSRRRAAITAVAVLATTALAPALILGSAAFALFRPLGAVVLLLALFGPPLAAGSFVLARALAQDGAGRPLRWRAGLATGFAMALALVLGGVPLATIAGTGDVGLAARNLAAVAWEFHYPLAAGLAYGLALAALWPSRLMALLRRR